jgi:hypothetical protein
MTDKNYHPLIDHREPPASLIALRDELPKHKEIYNKAIKGANFEECLAIVAAELKIVLDGYYDIPELCDLLVWELRRLDVPMMQKHPALQGAKIVETKDAILLEGDGLILPAPAELFGKSLPEVSKEELDAATKEDDNKISGINHDLIIFDDTVRNSIEVDASGIVEDWHNYPENIPSTPGYCQLTVVMYEDGEIFNCAWLGIGVWNFIPTKKIIKWKYRWEDDSEEITPPPQLQ